MYQIKKWVIVIMFCGFSTMALADWESATKVGEQETESWRYKQCIYETRFSGFRFSMIYQGSFCPTFVEYNPETGQVRE